MATTIKNNTVYAVEIEDTEGTYKAPTAADSFVQVLVDGGEMTPAKELLDRNVFNGSIGKSTPRTGTRTVSGAMPVEMRASDVEGDAPEYDALMRSALGSRRQKTSDTTTKTGHTSTVLQIEDADIGDFAVGDMVLVKESGAYHVSPVTAVDTTASAANITLLVAGAGAFTDNVVIAKFTTYTVADTGHPSLSVSKYVESAVLEQGAGCRVNSFSLENFTTGQLANWNFGFEGMSYDRSLTAPPFTPSYDSSLPPIILNACVYQDGVSLDVNEFAFSVENTLAFATSTCSSNGRISGRASERNITGSFNPYKQDNSVDQFDKFDATTEYSLFASAYVPTAVAGEFEQVVAVYMPNCITTEIGEADQDGLLQDALSFTAARGTDGTTNEIYVCSI